MREPAIGFPYSLAVVSFPLRSAIQRMTETSPVAENGANVAENVGNVGKNSADVGKNDGNNVHVNADEGKIGAENVGKTLTERQQHILVLVTDNPTISMAEMAKIIGVTTRTIEREIPKMEHTLRHIGPKNGGYWEIIES